MSTLSSLPSQLSRSFSLRLAHLSQSAMASIESYNQEGIYLTSSLTKDYFSSRLGWSEKEEAQKEIAHYALAQIQPRVVSFEEQVLIIREKLAELYESEKEWSKAAQMLSGIDLDSGMRLIDDTFRLSKCVQIARLYLEDDDAVNAEAFINKASFLVSNSQQEVLNLQYKVRYARILDLKRKFLEAALRYYDISQIEKRKIGDEVIDEDALEQALSAAVTCTILAV
ncbi:hypothetical protein K1719_035876 [Acacia pycnantha]|nr:hypothetical protein K1719_035876 [Acacia pycnantha]